MAVVSGADSLQREDLFETYVYVSIDQYIEAHRISWTFNPHSWPV